MGRVLLACLVPLLLACLAFALAFTGAAAQVGAAATALLVAAGGLFAASRAAASPCPSPPRR